MKKILWLLSVSFLFWGCVKSFTGGSNCQNVDPSLEVTQMIAFCDSKGIVYTKDSNDIFYQIIDTGAGIVPTDNSTISVTYHAYLLNGTFVDSTLAGHVVTGQLHVFIPGWRLAVPYIKKGGHIQMVIPSSLCYGCTGQGPIPPNAILYFDLELVDVQ